MDENWPQGQNTGTMGFNIPYDIGPFSPALCKAAVVFFSDNDSWRRFGAISKAMKFVIY